ncbi:CRISPR-associated protein Cas5 [Caloranaerobacter sp. DY30410]|uniref:CRISPR-associated protein Cas5 n=1 Tax=Caloranaerobacter sp. DY30410 TaxID=3238305 RepID=UPI003D03E12F
MGEKILKLNLYQPFAHYREPKIIQDDYIPTLNIPSPTTIAGMIAYLCDYKFKEEFDIGVYCKYKTKDIHFIRGEKGDFFESYLKQNRKKKLSYQDFKFKLGNRIMKYEVLQEVSLIIFLKFNNQDEYNMVKEALENPRRYITLGRKEDFVVKHKNYKKIVEDVTDKIKSIEITDKKTAVKNKYKIKNTYIPINIMNDKYDDILSNGVLYSLPRKYRNICADKTEREMVHYHYVYIDEKGYYPKNGKYYLYEDIDEKIIFKWLVKVGV